MAFIIFKSFPVSGTSEDANSYRILALNRGKLQALQQSVDAVRPATNIKTMLRKCPCCKTGTLITIEVFGKRGPPQKYFTGTTSAPVA